MAPIRKPPLKRPIQLRNWPVKSVSIQNSRGLQPPKSNWARKLDEAPYRAYPVRGGITFSFGGLGVNEKAQVLNTANRPIRGLYASGDIMGLFFHNYPSCTGQTRNIVFSLQAGREAAHLSN